MLADALQRLRDQLRPQHGMPATARHVLVADLALLIRAYDELYIANIQPTENSFPLRRKQVQQG